jgi:hypothetical protein
VSDGKFLLGNRYTYYDKNLCYEVSLKAINQGYQVRYGKSIMGQYYFEIVDPFERSEQK